MISPSRLLKKRWFVAGLLIALSSVSSASSSYGEVPVLRQTDSAASDLIAALVRAGRFTDAESVCHDTTAANLDPMSDQAAKRVIRLSQISTARQFASGHFDDAATLAASDLVTEMLHSYPEHPRRLFLKSQSLAVRREAARFAVLAAVVSADSANQLAASESLLRATLASRELANEIADERTRLQTQRGPEVLGTLADLLRLEQESLVESVSLALMQTDLLSADPDIAPEPDGIGAATQAEQAADQVLMKLPSGSTARHEIERLKTEAILRAGDRPRAAESYASLAKSLSKPYSATMLALGVRINMASGRLREAGKTLDTFYGDDPDTAPFSVEMDLVRLKYLLANSAANDATTDTSVVVRWIETIGRRNGAYATRRAEAISLSRLQSGGVVRDVDAALVAAQGRDWLRRGDAARAAELLAAAAAADADPDRAIRHAVEAAAAWSSLEDFESAAAILASTTFGHPSGSDAARIHLQSILLHAKAGNGQVAGNRDTLKSLLRNHLQRWPKSSTASGATEWLVKILTAEGDLVAAAEAGSSAEAWQAAYLASAPRESAKFQSRLQKASRSLAADSASYSVYAQTVATIADRDQLPKSLESDSDGFFTAVIQARRTGVIDPSLPTPPSGLSAVAVDALRKRMMADGRESPSLRKSIAAWLDRWSGDADDPIGSAERRLWSGMPDEAIRIIETFLAQSPKAIDRVERAAVMLSQSSDRRAQEVAVEYFDSIAAGVAQASVPWHEAKISAIELLRRMNRMEESSRRAQYILLTVQEIDAPTKRRYQELAKSNATDRESK
ncbi:hypothetical protein [Rubripirellula reticaptiva]|uniref:Anaphase-promoting complex, cyclosome, subunit 3 n=1 Tax=Rubripirellula reticaptiva TaxID=2528013 RepID=A0A5C6FBU9_9BACT|nr:hypothetical protein [Rubripirellula reticaptiva]TWU58047.1 hypothetical protein Poly59_09560 [Rubripirellula reticaptiva]